MDFLRVIEDAISSGSYEDSDQPVIELVRMCAKKIVEDGSQMGTYGPTLFKGLASLGLTPKRMKKQALNGSTKTTESRKDNDVLNDLKQRSRTRRAGPKTVDSSAS